MYKKPLITFLILVFAFGIRAQENESGSISGFVFDKSNKESVIGANVYFNELPLGSSTNMSGYYVITNVPPGEYTLVCDYVGYKLYIKKVKVGSNQDKRYNVFLEQEFLSAETIVVEADSIRTAEKLFRQPISKIELTPMQIKKIPQVAETDLLRSLQTMPGILPVSDFSSALYVRGGTPDQNLYMIDGADVYNPDHAFGIFSTFDTDAIKHVDMSKGGFGAEYGGRLSSVMDVTYLDGNREEFEGSLSVSFLSAKTNIQMPIGNIGSLSGSVRRTYLDKTAAKVIDDIPDYYFYDMNLKAFFDINPNNKLMISLFGGRDDLDLRFNEDSDEDIGFEYDWGNTTGSVRWTRVFTPKLFTNFWVTRSVYSSHFNFDGGLDFTERNKLIDITLKGYLEYAWSKKLFLNIGFEEKNLESIFDQTFPGGLVDVHQFRNHYVGYVASTWKPTPRWDINGGLRYNYFNSDRDFSDWDPRFSAKYRLSETMNLKFATGIYHQYLHRVPRGFISSIWTTSDEYQKNSGSFHLISGFQKELSDDFSVEAEVYYKTYDDIYIYNQNSLIEFTAKEYTEDGGSVYNDTQGLFTRGDGSSAGFEIMFKKDTGLITGWAGYSLAATKHTFDGINQGESYAPRHDRVSTVNVIANFDLKNSLRVLKGKPAEQGNSRWLFGLNMVYASGQPITVPSSAYITNALPDIGDATAGGDRGSVPYSIYPSTINSYRLPAYARLDLSLTYEKYFENWSISPYLQVFNALNRKNLWFIQYEDESTPEEIIQNVDETHMMPILPTFGVTIKF